MNCTRIYTEIPKAGQHHVWKAFQEIPQQFHPYIGIQVCHSLHAFVHKNSTLTYNANNLSSHESIWLLLSIKARNDLLKVYTGT